MSSQGLWFALLILLLLDLFFTAIRGSLLSARLPALMDMGDDTPEAVRKTMELLEKPRLRTSLRMGVVLTHFSLGGIAAWQTIILLPDWPWYSRVGLLFVAALMLLVLEHLLEGALLPNSEQWALRFTGAAQTMDAVFSPLSSVLVRLLGSPAMLEQRLTPVTEYELRNWVDKGEGEGSLDQGEREMIYSIFHFGETLTREIMVPRIDMLALDVDTPVEDAIQALTQSGHSRVPVYEETVDNVVGLIYAKDLLKVPHNGKTLANIRELLRTPYFVPEAKKVDELLDEMQSRRVHMAIVVDEYGGVAGLVTMEDIVEEIVGEIRDEYDLSEEATFTEVAPGEYTFDARIDLDEFNEIMGSHIEHESADSLGGLIYDLVGQVPVGGETIEVEGLALKVEQVLGRRIRKVRAVRIKADEGSDAPADASSLGERKHDAD